MVLGGLTDLTPLTSYQVFTLGLFSIPPSSSSSSLFLSPPCTLSPLPAPAMTINYDSPQSSLSQPGDLTQISTRLLLKLQLLSMESPASQWGHVGTFDTC